MTPTCPTALDRLSYYGVRLDPTIDPSFDAQPRYIAERVTDRDLYYFALFVRPSDAERYAEALTKGCPNL